MKYQYIISLPILAIVFSCAKENGTSAEPIMPESTNSETVQATIREDEENVKTTYTINEDTMVATFYWKGSESFARVIRHFDSSKQDANYYDNYYADIFTSYGELASTRTFTCSSPLEGDYQDMKIAFYPYFSQDANGANVGYPIGTNTTFTYNLQETIAYNSDNPLDGVVPMAGYYVQEYEEYDFKPLTGILAVRMTGIPATTTKLTISSESYKMSGSTATITGQTSKTKESTILTGLKTYSYDKGLCQSLMASDANKSKTYTFSNLDPSVEYTFYFPLPISANHNNDGITTLDDLTIKMYEGTRTIYSNTANKSITIKRGYITRLPKITYSEDKVTAKIIGPSTDPVLKIWSGGKVVRSRAYISTSSEFVKDNCNLAFTTNPVTYHLINWTTGTYKLDGSGKYYLHYMALSEDVPASAITSLDGDERVVDYGTIEFYYLNNTDSGNIIGTFLRDINIGTASNLSVEKELNLTGGNTLTIEPSDDLSKGNVMITGFAGYSYNLENCALPTTGLIPGKPLYGTFIGTNAVFPYRHLSQEDAFYNEGTTAHYISAATSALDDITLNYSTDKIVSEGRWLADSKSYTVGTYRIYWQDFYTAYRTSGQIALTGNMITASSTAGSDNVSHLVDKNASTIWHAAYSGTHALDENYGIYLDIDLGDGNTVTNFTIMFQNRNQYVYNYPNKYKVYGYNTSTCTWDVLTGSDPINAVGGNDRSGLWSQCRISDNVTPYQKIRLSIIETTCDGGVFDLLTTSAENNQGTTHLAELQLWEN